MTGERRNRGEKPRKDRISRGSRPRASLSDSPSARRKRKLRAAGRCASHPSVRPKHGDRCAACRIAQVLSKAKERAVEKGVPFTLAPATTPPVPATCPVCSGDMEPGNRGTSSPSLDRWEPAAGYAPENVWWICCRCNTIKGGLSAADHAALADRLERAWEGRHGE